MTSTTHLTQSHEAIYGAIEHVGGALDALPKPVRGIGRPYPEDHLTQRALDFRVALSHLYEAGELIARHMQPVDAVHDGPYSEDE